MLIDFVGGNERSGVSQSFAGTWRLDDPYRTCRVPLESEYSVTHCSYCFPRVRDIIFKLETFPHLEFSSGQYVDPNYIVGRVVCGYSLFDPSPNIIFAVDVEPSELDLPPEAAHMRWRLPFIDLAEIGVDLARVRSMALCDPPLNVLNGTIQPYE
jgi:hypothetical protein